MSLDEAVSSGVTLQLLESVKAMSAPEGVRALDMAFRWARLEPLEAGVPTRIELPRAATEATAQDVISRFSKAPDVEYDQILGKVVRLERAEGSEHGQVVVDGSVGKQRRRVEVPLSGEAYRRTIAAHDSFDAVVVEGTFACKSRGWRMQEGASIRVVDLSQPSDSAVAGSARSISTSCHHSAGMLALARPRLGPTPPSSHDAVCSVGGSPLEYG